MLEFLEKVWDCISVGEVTSLVSIPSTIKKKKKEALLVKSWSYILCEKDWYRYFVQSGRIARISVNSLPPLKFPIDI